MCRGDRVARRQVCQLHAPATEKGVRTNEERVGPLARKILEGRIDLPTVAGVDDLDLQAHRAGSEIHISQRSFNAGTLVGLTSTATREAPGTNSRRSSSRFAVSS